jgi:GLPGLI family protein
MKKIIFITLLVANIASAQKITGTAVYESKVSMGKDFDVKMEGADPEIGKKIMEMMKKQMEKKYFLYFNNFESIFVEEEKLEQPSVGDGMVVNFHTAEKPSKSYKNIKEKTTIEEEDFFSKEFLVSDSLTMMPWEITDETKKIGNYTCTKAIVKIKAEELMAKIEQKKETSKVVSNLLDNIKPKDKTITAWFTTEIPVSNGPDNYWGLPGLILEVSDERTTFLCSKITLNPTEAVKIEKPKKGKKISKKEFEKIMDEKMSEMMGSGGKKGEGIQIQIIGN